MSRSFESWEPSFIIGIDFGMTCTAVAYSESPGWDRPFCIQEWPRPPNSHGQLDNKVATQVGYDEQDRLLNWGFLSGADGMKVRLEKEFKLYVDPAFPDENPGRPTHDEALQYYQDYMKSLHDYLELFLSEKFPDWQRQKVEYVFSIPTTWKHPRITARLEQVLAEAGFENRHNRKLTIYLTEAEAAAVNAAKQSFRVGDIVMVADAGGATTDINVLELVETNDQRTKLKALTQAEGINVGSTLIDEQVRQLIRTQLRQKGVRGDDIDLHWIADDMLIEKRFEGIKCSFAGDPYQIQLENVFTIPLNDGPNVRDRRVTLSNRDLKGFFDSQIQVMAQKIEEQTAVLMRERPRDHIKYLVLSGGLGSSRYVQRRLRERFPNMTILCAIEPQLAVAKGLVMDRVQALKTGVGIYTGKCSRVSYGVLCDQLYDKKKHKGEPIEKDPLDNLTYAKNQIDWLIQAGEPVREGGFTRPYRLKIPRNGQPSQSIDAQFVMSENRANDLPRSLRMGHVEKVCKVYAVIHDLSSFHRKSGSFFSRARQQHYIADFKLKVIVGSTDLKFEIVSNDGEKYSSNTASVLVEWQEVTRPVPTEKALPGPRSFVPLPLHD